MYLLVRLTTLSNIITLLRAPLALMFLYESYSLRVFSVALAMLSDGLDGYVARRFKTVSRLGTILDPIMDRFFVAFAFAVLAAENRLFLWEIVAMLSRDIVLLVSAAFVTVFADLNRCEAKATFWGKATTFSQFCVLIAVVLGVSFPWYVYLSFVGFALMLIKELYILYHEVS